MRNFLSFIWEIVKIAIIAALIVLPIRYFIFQPFLVQGSSMEPNFENGDYLLIDEISYRFRDPQRGEIIVFKYPYGPQRFIKRIVGLPGETIKIEGGKVFIFEEGELQPLDESDYLPLVANTPGNIRVTLKENNYFVLGDNRTASADSRSWGSLPEQNIIGRVFLRAWPVAKVEVW